MSESREPVRFAGPKSATGTVMALRPMTALVAAALAIVTIGTVMNWSALVAAGIAPLIITALPCAVMCALGLCMSRMGGSSCAMPAQSQQSDATTESVPLNSLAARADVPEPGGALVGPSHLEVEPRQVEQQLERRPVNA